MRTEHADLIADTIAGMNVMGLVVQGKRVAVIRDPSEEKVGSLYIPEEGKRKEPRGTVVALGRAVEPEDDILVGDRVMYTKYAPIYFSIALPDARKVEVELLHVSDIYMLWNNTVHSIASVEEENDR